jgi:hypothetical protein
MSINPSSKPTTNAKPVTLVLDNFSGGLNTNELNLMALDETELSSIINWKFKKTNRGVKLKSRSGLLKSSLNAPANGSINDLFHFVSSSGTAYWLAVADSDLNYLNAGAFTKIGDLSSTRGRMCRFNNKLIVADGGILKYWDGQSFGNLTDIGIATSNILIDGLDNLNPAGDIVAMTNGGVGRVAQFFTTPAFSGTATLSSISVKLIRAVTGTCTGNITAVLYASNGSTVIETSSTTLDPASVYADMLRTYTFTFTTALSPSTSYHLAILWGGGGDGTIGVGYLSGANANLNGYLKYYDGLWTSLLTNDVVIKIELIVTAPYASFVIQKQNRIYCNDNIHPNWLWYCNVNDPNDWSTANGGGYLIFDGHYKINGAFSFYGDIYIFADNPKAIYLLTGDTPAEYTAKKIFDGVTAESQDSIQSVGGDLIFKDSRGIYSLRTMQKYGDVEQGMISKKVNNYITLYTGNFSTNNLEDSQYWFSAGYIAGPSSSVFVFDLEIGAWTTYDFNVSSTANNNKITAMANMNGTIALGMYDGNLYYLNETATQDNSRDFTLSLTTGWHDLFTHMAKKASYVDCVLSGKQAGTYTLTIYNNFSGTAIETLTMNQFYTIFQNINHLSFEFEQVKFMISGLSSIGGSHWLDRILLECAILSRVT